MKYQPLENQSECLGKGGKSHTITVYRSEDASEAFRNFKRDMQDLKNMAASFGKQRHTLHLNPIHLNGAELQYQTHPHGRVWCCFWRNAAIFF